MESTNFDLPNENDVQSELVSVIFSLLDEFTLIQQSEHEIVYATDDGKTITYDKEDFFLMYANLTDTCRKKNGYCDCQTIVENQFSKQGCLTEKD
ncbi:MAG: hypothetical protein AAF632_26105 [Bacteroidota bacterium]